MCNYTPSEIVGMTSISGECQKDYRANAWLPRERFPDRRLEEEICTDDVTEVVLAVISLNSHISAQLSYQSTNIVKANYGMSHVTHLTKARSRIVDY